MTTLVPARRARARSRALWLVGLTVALGCAGVLSYYASGSPDGLERVAELLGFAEAAAEHSPVTSPLADYEVAGLGRTRLSGGVAGVLGTLTVLAVTSVLMWAVRRRPAGNPK